METESKKSVKLTEICAVCGKRNGPDANDASVLICSCQAKTKRPQTPAKAQDKDAALLQPGDLLADWLILEKLGTGGLTRVYKARAKNSEELFVVKELRRTFAENPRNTKMFEVESKESKENLHHPNIVEVFAYGRTPKGLPYQVAEYVGCPSLLLKIADGPSSEQESLKLFSLLCDALIYAHEKNIVHGSIQPTNIFLDLSKNVVKLADFGLAKVLPNAARETKFLTPEGERMGDPQYASPEYLIGERLDARSDIYSLGCVMYQVLTGTTPFSGSSRMQMALSQLSDQAKSLPGKGDGTQKKSALENVIGRCLEKDPARRYQSAKELKDDLSAVQGGKYINALPPQPRSLKQDIAEVKTQLKNYKVPIYILGCCVLLSGMLQISENYQQITDAVRTVFSKPKAGGPTPDFHEHLEPIEDDHTAVLHTKSGTWIGDCYTLPESHGIRGAFAQNKVLRNVELINTSLDGLELPFAQMKGAMFIGVNFHGVNLEHANLSNASFIDCDLSGCHLDHADLEESYFLRTKLDGATCVNTNFANAFFDRISSKQTVFKDGNFRNAVVINSTGDLTSHIQKSQKSPNVLNIHSIDFESANLDGVKIMNARLFQRHFISNATRRGAYLAGASLYHSDMSYNDLRGVNLDHADLRNADLRGSDLTGATFREANLSHVDLSSAKLYGADLTGANLTGANISSSYLDGAKFTAVTFDRTAMNVQLYKTALPPPTLFKLNGPVRIDSKGLSNSPLLPAFEAR